MSRTRNRRRRKHWNNSTPQQLIERGDYRGAVHLFRQQINIAPTDQLKRSLSICLCQLKDDQGSLDTIQTIEAPCCEDHFRAGLCLIGLKRWDDAIQQLQRALSSSETASGYYWCAVAAARGTRWPHDDDRKTVVACLRMATDRLHCPPDAFLWLESLDESQDDGATSLAIFAKGLEANPDSVAIRLKLVGRLSYRDPQRGLELLSALADQPSCRIDWLWHSFMLERNLGNRDRALQFLEALASEFEDKSFGPGITQLRGELLIDLGRPEEAIECFDRELAKTDTDARLLAFIGRCHAHLLLNDEKAATDDAGNAFTLWPVDEHSIPGCPSVIRVQDRDFYFEHEAGTQILQRFAAKPASQFQHSLIGFIQYGCSRTATPYKVQALNAIKKSFDVPVVHHDLSCRYHESGKIERAIAHHFSYAVAEFDARGCFDGPTFYEGTNHQARGYGRQAHAAFIKGVLPKKDDKTFLDNVAEPLYSHVLRAELIHSQLFAELLNVSSYFCAMLEGDKQPYFDKAYALHMLKRHDEAAPIYRQLIARYPQHSSAMHNLSMILEEAGQFQEALDLAQQVAKLEPHDKKFAERPRAIADRFSKVESERQRREEFQATARERYPELDFAKKRILSTLTVISSFDSLAHLAELSGTGEKYVEGNWRKLVELGMVVFDEREKPVVNKYIVDLVRQERTHAVATTIIRADKTIGFKPIFNSQLEYTIYNVLIGLFPNHLVFPNMSLQTVFQYDRLKGLLDSETFRYYLMSQVDFCITSTASYLPLICFEVDSAYHDLEEQKERDRKKNEIFRLGGVPLLRLRAHGQPSIPTIREDVVKAVRELGKDVRGTGDIAGNLVNLTIEIDFEQFG